MQPLVSWTPARSAFETSVAALNEMLSVAGDDDRMHRSLGLAYAGLGRREEAVAAGLRALQLVSPDDEAFLGPYNLSGMAMIYAQLGDGDLAVEHLQELFSIPGPDSITVIGMDPRYDPIRDHSGFRALQEDFGYSPRPSSAENR